MEVLKPYRERIDVLDDQIIDLLVARTDIIREVGDFKYHNDIPATLPDRVNEVIDRVVARATEKGLDPELVRGLYTAIVSYSCALEEDIKAAMAGTEKKAAEG